jgi:hypothetical protein
MTTYKLSPSSLSLMQECPRCFWLAQHKVWSRPSGIFPSLPSGMDSILKKHFDKFMEINKLPPELCDNHECKDMKLFSDKDLLKVWRSNLKGISFTNEEGNILHGAVDNLLVKGKKIIVLDYKTRGFPLKEDTHEHYQHQLDIYNFLLRKNGYETEDYAFLLFYHPKEVLANGDIVFNKDLVRMKIDVKNAENIFNNAIKLLNEECPTKTCEWCEGK